MTYEDYAILDDGKRYEWVDDILQIYNSKSVDFGKFIGHTMNNELNSNTF